MVCISCLVSTAHRDLFSNGVYDRRDENQNSELVISVLSGLQKSCRQREVIPKGDLAQHAILFALHDQAQYTAI